MLCLKGSGGFCANATASKINQPAKKGVRVRGAASSRGVGHKKEKSLRAKTNCSQAQCDGRRRRRPNLKKRSKKEGATAAQADVQIFTITLTHTHTHTHTHSVGRER